MSWAAAQKRLEAARKRDERASLKRQKELERMLKEQEKLSVQEQARLEVDAFENSMEVLLSVHRDSRPQFDWIEPLCALPPHMPMHSDMESYEKERAEWEKMRSLAKRVLAGEEKAYSEALRELSAFGELSTLGSSIAFRVHHRNLIECELKVNGRDAIPAEVKSLTAAGKLSVKAMPKARFHEAYQDYVCGCVLRVARESLALLPVDSVIVTALVSTVQTSTGTNMDTPVLSVAFPRQSLARLDFARLDPSDSMENFIHRGDVLTSRKSGEFVAIVPLKPEDIPRDKPAQLNLTDVLHRVREMHAKISTRLTRLVPDSLSTSEAKPPTP
jgi:hypothetical protein